MKFRLAFKVHSSLFTTGTRYILLMSGLARFMVYNGMLKFTPLWPSSGVKETIYISSDYLVNNGWNDIELYGNGTDQIILKVNSYNFTVFKSGITGRWYTGFSDSTYIEIPNIYTSDLNSFSLQTKFYSTDMTVSNAGLFDMPTPNQSTRFTITSSGLLYFRRTIDGTNNYDLQLQGTTSLPTYTELYAKVTFDITTGYKLFYSYDGEYWIQDADSSFNTPPLVFATEPFRFGDNCANASSFQGRLDMLNTILTRNNNIVFNGKTAVAGTDYTVVGNLNYNETVRQYPTFDIGQLKTFANSWLVLKEIEAVKVEDDE